MYICVCAGMYVTHLKRRTSLGRTHALMPPHRLTSMTPFVDTITCAPVLTNPLLTHPPTPTHNADPDMLEVGGRSEMGGIAQMFSIFYSFIL